MDVCKLVISYHQVPSLKEYHLIKPKQHDFLAAVPISWNSTSPRSGWLQPCLVFVKLKDLLFLQEFDPIQ